MYNKRSIGTKYEEIAKQYLSKSGVKILDNNFRCKIGEIDLIGKNGDTYVFVEVKYRKDLSLGHPAEAVDYKKRRTICRVADYYRMKYKISEYVPCRFDVVAILRDEIIWYKNAFDYI